MPKNKGKYRSQDPTAELLGPDELQTATARFVQAAQPHAKKILAVVAAVIVAVVALGIYSWYAKKRDARATALFSEAVAILRAPIGPPPPPEAAKDMIVGDLPYPSVKARAEAALVVLQKLASEHGGTAVADEAALIHAGVLYDLGRYDEAMAKYRAVLAEGPGDKIVYVAREGLAYAAEAKALAQTDPAAQQAGLGEALKLFEQLQPEERGFYRDYALFHQARVKAALGDKPAAVALLKQLKEKHPGSPLVGEADERLARLEAGG